MTDPIIAPVMTVLGKYVLGKGEVLAREAGPAAAIKAGELLQTVLNYLRRDAATKVIADRYQQDPEKARPLLEDDLNTAIQADANFAAQLKELLAQYQAEAKAYAATGATYSATLKGSGAIAQGGGDALGQGAVKAGDVHGAIITGSGNVIHTGRASGSPVSLPPTLAPLRDKLTHYFNKGELKTLCFDLGVAYDDLPGDTRTELAQALVEYCHERGRLPELVRRCQAERPHVEWS